MNLSRWIAFGVVLNGLLLGCAQPAVAPRTAATAVWGNPARWAQEAEGMDAAQVEAYKKRLSDDWENVEIRFKMLTYSFKHLDVSTKPGSYPYRGIVEDQYLWFVGKYPASDYFRFWPVVSQRPYKLQHTLFTYAWENAVSWHPKDPKVLANALAFFEKEDPDKAAALRLRLQNLGGQARP